MGLLNPWITNYTWVPLVYPYIPVVGDTWYANVIVPSVVPAVYSF